MQWFYNKCDANTIRPPSNFSSSNDNGPPTRKFGYGLEMGLGLGSGDMVSIVGNNSFAHPFARSCLRGQTGTRRMGVLYESRSSVESQSSRSTVVTASLKVAV